jgi:hypothetical protein
VAAAVIGLLSEAIRKIASRRSGASLPNDGEPIVSTCSSPPWATSVTSPGSRPAATCAAIESCRGARPSLDSTVGG